MEANLCELAYQRIVHGQEAPTEEGFIACPVHSDYDGWYVGIDAKASTCILIRTDDQARPPAPIKLDTISVQFGVPCTLLMDSQVVSDGIFTVIQLTRNSPQERQSLFWVCDAAMSALGVHPSYRATYDLVDGLVEIFSPGTMRDRRGASGLFGELLVIYLANNPIAFIDNWRNDPTDTYDFSDVGYRIEVKTSSNRQRHHHLSMSQCIPPHGTEGVLLSVFAERVSAGMTLADIVAAIERTISGHPTSIFKLRSVIADTLQGDETALDAKFDLEFAVESLSAFDLRKVPAIRPPILQGLTSVRFRSDVSLSPALDIDDLGWFRSTSTFPLTLATST